MRLLLIETDPTTAGWLGPRLESQGFRPQLARDADQVLRDRLADSAAAIVVELGNEAPEGRRLTSTLRSAGITLPLVIVSARSDWREAVASLDAGADDFVVMPARSEEIAARLRVTIRRSNGQSGDRFRTGDFELDLNARCAWFRGRCLELTRNEFTVLRLLLLNPGTVVSHEQIRAAISPGARTITLNAIEVQIARLRKKVGRDSIRTMRGLGYRYVEAVPSGDQHETEPCRVSGASCHPQAGNGHLNGSDWHLRDESRLGEVDLDSRGCC